MTTNNHSAYKPLRGRKHSHYFKFCPYEQLDPYGVLEVFGVTDQMVGHAIKKLLMPGERGIKDMEKDIDEAIDTLLRRREMKQIRAEAEARRAGSLGEVIKAID